MKAYEKPIFEFLGSGADIIFGTNGQQTEGSSKCAGAEPS